MLQAKSQLAKLDSKGSIEELVNVYIKKKNDVIITIKGINIG